MRGAVWWRGSAKTVRGLLRAARASKRPVHKGMDHSTDPVRLTLHRCVHRRRTIAGDRTANGK